MLRLTLLGVVAGAPLASAQQATANLEGAIVNEVAGDIAGNSEAIANLGGTSKSNAAHADTQKNTITKTLEGSVNAAQEELLTEQTKCKKQQVESATAIATTSTTLKNTQEELANNEQSRNKATASKEKAATDMKTLQDTITEATVAVENLTREHKENMAKLDATQEDNLQALNAVRTVKKALQAKQEDDEPQAFLQVGHKGRKHHHKHAVLSRSELQGVVSALQQLEVASAIDLKVNDRALRQEVNAEIRNEKMSLLQTHMQALTEKNGAADAMATVLQLCDELEAEQLETINKIKGEIAAAKNTYFKGKGQKDQQIAVSKERLRNATEDHNEATEQESEFQTQVEVAKNEVKNLTKTLKSQKKAQKAHTTACTASIKCMTVEKANLIRAMNVMKFGTAAASKNKAASFLQIASTDSSPAELLRSLNRQERVEKVGDQLRALAMKDHSYALLQVSNRLQASNGSGKGLTDIVELLSKLKSTLQAEIKENTGMAEQCATEKADLDKKNTLLQKSLKSLTAKKLKAEARAGEVKSEAEQIANNITSLETAILQVSNNMKSLYETTTSRKTEYDALKEQLEAAMDELRRETSAEDAESAAEGTMDEGAGACNAASNSNNVVTLFEDILEEHSRAFETFQTDSASLQRTLDENLSTLKTTIKAKQAAQAATVNTIALSDQRLADAKEDVVDIAARVEDHAKAQEAHTAKCSGSNETIEEKINRLNTTLTQVGGALEVLRKLSTE